MASDRLREASTGINIPKIHWKKINEEDWTNLLANSNLNEYPTFPQHFPLSPAQWNFSQGLVSS